jgi:flagella basal body P-ring formation protein FlgA
VPLLQTAAGPADAPAVLRGETVTIAIEGEGFSVTQPGEALDAGPVNAWIRVKSTSGNAEAMRARIVRPGLVKVDLGSDLP